MGKYPDSGALFNNDRKQGNQPDMWGSIEISAELAKHITERISYDGEASIRVAAWHQKGRNGTFLSLKVSEQQSTGQKPKPAPKVDIEDDIPF